MSQGTYTHALLVFMILSSSEAKLDNRVNPGQGIYGISPGAAFCFRSSHPCARRNSAVGPNTARIAILTPVLPAYVSGAAFFRCRTQTICHHGFVGVSHEHFRC